MTIAVAEPSRRATAAPPLLLRYGLVFLVAFAIGLAMVFVGFRSQGFADTTFDPYNFGEMGKSIARGDGFANFGSLIQRRAPLYPLLIGGIYYLFGEQATLVLLVQAMLFAATSVLAFDIGRRLFNDRTGIIAALLCAVSPMLLRYVGDLHVETLLTFLFTLTVWAMVRFYARPSVSSGFVVGLCAALASLTKAVVFPLPFVFVAVLVGISLVTRRQPRVSVQRLLAPLAAMFATLFVVIAPWTIRNYVATGGHIVLISSGASDAFLRGYIFSRPEFALLRLPPYTFAEIESNELFNSLAAAAGTEWQRDDYKTDQILNRAAVQKLVAEPGEFVRKFVTGLFTFWYEMTSGANSLIAAVLAAATWVLAIIGLRRASREGRQGAWIPIVAALYLNIFLAALLALGRYSVPVLPGVFAVSAFGIDALLPKSRAERA
jgi:4-amino-4-deoxy-L-arabinose transferase-like glycosyltransferase